jgi:hypothetical protein
MIREPSVPFSAAITQDTDAELGHHIELRAADLERSGLAPADAARQARLELGSRERYKDEARAAFGLRWLDDLRADALYALRILRRSPGFTATAVLSMALGVGANTIVFSVVNSVLLRPLPVSEPDRLLFVNRGDNSSHSYPDYLDLRDRAQTIDAAIGYRFARMGVGDVQSAEKYWGYLATGNYFDVLGIQPALGRFFHADDERGPNSSPFAVLSYDMWQTRFQADPNIAGKTVRVNAEPYTILGVAPQAFRGTELAITPALWVPMMMQPQIEGRDWLDSRPNHNMWVLIRPKPGFSEGAVQAELNGIAADLGPEFPAALIGPLETRPHRQSPAAPSNNSGPPCCFAALVRRRLPESRRAPGSPFADRFAKSPWQAAIGAGRVASSSTPHRIHRPHHARRLTGGAVSYARYLTQWRPPIEIPLQVDVHPDLAAAASILTGTRRSPLW